MSLETDLAAVRSEYRRRMTLGNNPLLRQVEQYITAHDGKMLRPRMLIAAAATLPTTATTHRRTLMLATCVEMLHNVSLLHDDVIDHADQRRAQPSVNARWGNNVAVLVGDYLLAQIMQLLNELDDAEAARRINSTVMAMVESELLAHQVMLGQPMTEQTYLSIIDGKTARLFATSAALGNPDYEEYGLHYGRLFQLRDDVSDAETTPFTNALIAAEEHTLSTLPQLRLQ